MSTFNFARKFQDQAKDLIKRKGIKDIVFSDGSYQIEVYDKEEKTSFWPFIQLDDRGKVRDAFCTCATSEEKGECLHLAAAHLAIFQSSDQPLANRFYQSFWHYLCFIASSRIGSKPQKLKKSNEGQYSFYSKTNKLLFSLKLFSKSSEKKFSEILFTPLADKEGASLKYSHLSEEEIKLWKKGEASREMNYELSFWSDLAKWWMFLQEQNVSYKIHFTDGGEHPPRIVNIHFPEIFESIFYISEKNWKYLIPTLRTVKSALKVIEEKEKKIHQILYHKDKKAFEIVSKEKAIHEKEKTGYQLGEWTYVKDIGFYRRSTDPIAEKRWIEKQEVSSYLSNHLGTFQKHLSDYEIHPLPIQAQYHIFFDKEKNLHIRIYLFNLEECFAEEAGFFCPWFFLPKKGFYLVDDPLFKEKETLILKENISSFVHEHRLWLHEFEGFHTHFGVLPTKFRYRLTQENNLEFFLKIELPQMPDKLVDFDDWLYVEGHGFYLKKETKTTLPLRPGLMIQEKEIPKFIDTHVEELEQIKGFFSENCPVEDAKISIYSSDHEIIVEPKIFLKEGYSFSDIKFFGDYLHVTGEGFSKMPARANIPNRYQTKTTIAFEKIAYFLNYELDRLKPFIGEIDPKLVQPTGLHLKIKKVQKEVKRGKTTWLVDLSYKSNLGEVSTIHLWEDVHSERLYSFTKAGAILLKQPRFNWLFQLTKRKVNPKKKFMRLTTLEWIRLCIFENVQPPKGYSKQAKQTRAYLKELTTLQTEKLLNLDYLLSSLWPYQETGVKWLWFLYTHGLSGLLCDDMGLGKTHQSMALLAAVLYEDLDRVYKYLVICPTSVIYHWEELFRKFLPQMRVLTYYGVERTLKDFDKNYDLILTSYGTLRQSKENLKPYRFEVAIFDELQVAKNPFSQTHKALKNIRSNVRLGLSGTPIENTLKELKALFDIVLPSYFPTEAVFRDVFLNPIEKHQDQDKKALLSKLIKPFVLRRKKVDVLLDLPEKMEEVAYCRLSKEQEDLYQQYLKSKRDQLIESLKDEGKPVPFMHIFAMLTKLKQICNHPSLILKDLKNYQEHQSGKWDLFIELLNEARDSRQKVVIFSQYLEMMEIIEHHLKKKNISYGSIKGATKNRYQQIQKFQKDPDCEVFVASLLAAGVGIDLTAGSVVIHYDRWWNPAKENQATDRVHRIGQNRGVQVFKLVTKNTIEEDIHEIIQKKYGLMEELIGKDDSEQIKTLSREELISVLEKTKQVYL